MKFRMTTEYMLGRPIDQWVRRDLEFVLKSNN